MNFNQCPLNVSWKISTNQRGCILHVTNPRGFYEIILVFVIFKELVSHFQLNFMGKRQSKTKKTLAVSDQQATETIINQDKMEAALPVEKEATSHNDGDIVHTQNDDEKIQELVTNAKEVKDGVAYEVVIKPALEPEKKPNIESPAKEISKEIVEKKLGDAAHRRQILVSERRHRITTEIEHVKQVHHVRSEIVEQKTKLVAVKLEEKRKTVEAKQEAARLELEKQRQAKQERFKDVLQHAHEKEEKLVKSTEEKITVKTEVSSEKREAIIKGIKEQQKARFKKIEIAKNIREEIQQNRSKDLEEKTQQKFLTAKELLENQEKARQEKFEAEEERLRRAKHVSEENIENEIRKKAEKSQQKMEKYKENHEAQLEARLEKLRAKEQHREEVRLKKSERKTLGTPQG
ncbi:uncharacterized protein At1g10890-like [Dendronephthya gigantea]|uniref:uncharacterized protein At1g10890-like n=1 Tax=Dendronephthya gigantea TaxID=151771 RepID=UPI00106C07E4|nr:uncharacterized protein At1g10890-like [Dendronephthya gigantea]